MPEPHRANDPPMLVRYAESRDMPAIAALTNHFIAHTPIHFGTERDSPQEMEAAWAKSRARYPWLVAEFDARFAGYAKAGVWRDRAAYQWTPEVGIYVELSMHKRGVGSALYRTLIDLLRRQGFHSIVAGITLPNDASVRLHESVGFKHTGLVRDAGFKLGRWHDVGFWQISLGDTARAPDDLAPPPPINPATFASAGERRP